MTTQNPFEGLAAIKERNAMCWAGVRARNEQLERNSRGWDPYFPMVERSVLAKQASKGGRAPKADVLTKAIQQLVEQNPDIMELEIRRRLQHMEAFEFLDENDHGASSFHTATQIRYFSKDRQVTLRFLG